MANIKIREIPRDDEASRILHDEMTDEYQTRHVYIDEDNTCMSIHYEKFAEEIENFDVKNNDVWVCSYPKTGTTWTQEMVWMIMNNLDFQGGQLDLLVRFPFLELAGLFDMEKTNKLLPEDAPGFPNTLHFVRDQLEPRLIKTHLPFSLLPREIRNGTKTPKIIYVMRNPKDTCVSFYHHCRMLQGCRASLEDFAKVFLADKVMYGSYWKHILGYWTRRNLPNLLIIKYEDMKENLPAVITKVAKFLDKKLTNEQIEKLTQHLSFEAMKNNKSLNGDDIYAFRKMNNLTFGDGSFIRAGKVGKYKEELSAETLKRFDEWIKENIKGTDFGDQYSHDF